MNGKWHRFIVVTARLSILVYIGMVIYVCFGHFDDLPDMNHTFLGIPEDKIIHFIMFFPFPIIAAIALNRRPRSTGRAFLQAGLLFLCGIAIAAATEIGQGMTDYRDPSVYDWVADISALLLSTLIVLVVLLIKARRVCPADSAS